MNWLNKLEQKYGSKAIPNITRIFIAANLIGSVLLLTKGDVVLYYLHVFSLCYFARTGMASYKLDFCAERQHIIFYSFLFYILSVDAWRQHGVISWLFLG